MAARDFAHASAPTSKNNVRRKVKKKPTRKKSEKSFVRALLFFLCLVLAAVLGYVLGLQQDARQGFLLPKPILQDVTQQEQEQQALEQTVARLSQTLEERQQALLQCQQQVGAEADVGELQFYGDLPEQAVTPSPLHAPDASSSITSVINKELKTTHYTLQLASFRHVRDARKLVRKLASGSYHASVHRIVKSDVNIWYRVSLGHFQDKADAEVLKLEIEQRFHIKGLIRRE